ncbi:hypothetical protein PV328_001784 [Microctonus aethiopoides]|uniref:TOG domain-containing protein n=1 Tax=Microctonus aethiopoides TaxID=144406 RepID=A0AA39FYE6_9HYME|nr:hypothetical protein PV328_001784 [Microctonus aethiopoides]
MFKQTNKCEFLWNCQKEKWICDRDDWRARVRGLERVASALRTSSALIAIESRLGSLLQCVLGGERSCRVAAAGMAVARVMSEEALKRRLPQVAWGLTRQGGPNAAQLARIAMLRLRPALFLEQLLQPHCIDARNAKTRENALQLLIFSLVTFPSTEFKVENVANKVALMVGDRRRRVRQAALDTLAVLAQIYEAEEVLQAGQRAAKQLKESTDMVAAIRARLARKSLPMVSADGLVVYGLQISPTVQIATGPDVDWIVAGSGSVSPGTGRSRGQIISMNGKTEMNLKNSKANNDIKKNSSSMLEKNFVAVGVGLHPKSDRAVAWQLVQPASKNEDHLEGYEIQDVYRNTPSNTSIGNSVNVSLLWNDKDVMMKQRKTEENFHKRMDEIYSDRSHNIVKIESRIPIRQLQDRHMIVRHSTAYQRRRHKMDEDNYQMPSSAPHSSKSESHDAELQRRYRSDRIKQQSRPVSKDQSERTSPKSSHPQEAYVSSDRHNRRKSYIQTAAIEPEYFNEVQSKTSRGGVSTSGLTTENISQESWNNEPKSSRIFSTPIVFNGVIARAMMIFKYCTWPSEAKDNTNVSPQPIKSCTNIEIIKRTLFICCPCAFRHRQSVGIENINNDEISIITEIPLHITTPIISLRPNQNTEFMYENKTNTENDKDEYNGKNYRHVSAQANISKQNSTDQGSQCSGHDRETYESSSDVSTEIDGGTASHQEIHESDMRNSSSEKSFDVITHNSNPSRRNSIDQMPVNILSSTTTDSTDIDKETSLDDIPSGREVDSDDPPVHDPPSSSSVISNDSNSIDEVTREVVSSRRSSGMKPIAFDEIDGPNISLAFDRNYSNEPTSDIKSRTVNSNDFESIAFFQSTDFRQQKEDLAVGGDERVEEEEEEEEEVEAEAGDDDDDDDNDDDDDDDDDEEEEEDQDEIEEVKEKSKAVVNSVSIIVASRPHSQATAEYREVAFQPLDIRQSHETTETSGSGLVIHELSSHTAKSIDDENISIKNEIVSMTELNANDLPLETELRVVTVGKINQALNKSHEDGIQHENVKPHKATNEVTTPKKFQSRVPRSRVKEKIGLNKIVPVTLPSSHNMEKPSGKIKSSMSQCLTQLESNDWEVTIKGLKALSVILRQHPEQLDTCPPGIFGRLLGRHVRNLRSQVSRMACLAAGDAFETEARCIDQDLDDIVGPLLHRTADTNKFLRADSNAALDRMVEHLPPHRTIAVIVYRGASHQNPIVRATSARLLCSVVDRIGPSLAMTLPRDAREKLLNSGAKLLMDGNLDARNHAKTLFKRLSRCEGFRKALTDSVPEATLRHIDKTLRSL